MFVPAVVFLVGMGVVFGVDYAAVQRPEDEARDIVQQRLAGQSAKKPR